MFIWDFVADTVLGQIIDWLYGQIVGFLGDFFMQMGSMGAELFEMSWVQSVVLLFYYLAWALYVTGIVVAAFECGIEYQNGRGSIRDTALNVIKGFLAASLFTTVPVELYKLSISLQGSLQLVLQDWEKILGRCGRDCAVSSGCCYLARSCYIWSFWWNRKYQQPDFYDLSS